MMPMKSAIPRRLFLTGQGAQEISFKLNQFETPWTLMGKRTNSNIHQTVTDGPFAVQICHRRTFYPKKKNPYWHRVSLPVMQTLCNTREYSRRLMNIRPCQRHHHVYVTEPVRHL